MLQHILEQKVASAAYGTEYSVVQLTSQQLELGGFCSLTYWRGISADAKRDSTQTTDHMQSWGIRNIDFDIPDKPVRMLEACSIF